jgi:hypothetical protein
MGLFAWLASRWTPEFEYRDRLADEVEDIAYESTRIGTRRGFLMGVLVGIILAMIGIGAFRTSGLETRLPPASEPREVRQQATSPQPSSEELTLLRKENEQLKEELTRAKAAGPPPREERAVEVEPSPPQVKADVPAPMKEDLTRAKAAGPPPREKRVVEPSPPQVKADVPAKRPSKTAAREPAVKPGAEKSAPDSAVAQPIPSNCRKEGDCDPVSP